MSRNRLAQAASAYLKSAAHQPIHWYPWSAEAFAAAREADRPVLLDIGAVWCHWCHVMDGESYEDPALAGYLNEQLRLHQGGSRRAARRGRALPARGPGDHRAGRLAAHRLPHPGGRGVLRRHLLPSGREVRPARLPHRARQRARGLPGPAGPGTLAGPGDPPGGGRAPRRGRPGTRRRRACSRRPSARWLASSTGRTAASAPSPSFPIPAR